MKEHFNTLSLAALGLYNYILDLDAYEGFNVKKLVEITGCSKSEVSKALDELVLKGYVDNYSNYVYTLNIERFIVVACGPCEDELDDYDYFGRMI